MKTFQTTYNSSSNSDSRSREKREHQVPPVVWHRWAVLVRSEQNAINSLPGEPAETRPPQNVYLDPLTARHAATKETATIPGFQPVQNYNVQTAQETNIPSAATATASTEVDPIAAAREAVNAASPLDGAVAAEGLNHVG